MGKHATKSQTLKKNNNKNIAGSKTIKLNDRKRLTINYYKNKAYVHMNDCYSKKSFTFNFEEIQQLQKKLPKILKVMKKISGLTEEHNKTKNVSSDSENQASSESSFTSYDSD